MDAGAFVVLASMLFGAVVGATDGGGGCLAEGIGASKKLGTLIEGESLLNDGTAIVAFVLLIGVVTGAQAFLGTGSFIGSARNWLWKNRSRGGLVGVNRPDRDFMGEKSDQRSPDRNHGGIGDCLCRVLYLRTFLSCIRSAGLGCSRNRDGWGWTDVSVLKLSTLCTNSGNLPHLLPMSLFSSW